MTAKHCVITGLCLLLSAAAPLRAAGDLSVWPNDQSRANSDPWLAAHHDQLRQMRPRVLVINFSNEHSRDHVEQLVARIIAGIREGSRWRGYADSKAPAFLEYEVFKFVDLRDPGVTVGDSTRQPRKPVTAPGKPPPFAYAGLYTPEFAKLIGVRDERAGADGPAFLTLGELVNRGLIHEVWLVDSGNESAGTTVSKWESIELKQAYDVTFAKRGDTHVHAGNGRDRQQPWIGRSLRIGAINASRGPGCFLESLSHSFEEMAKCEAVPYLTPYFREFAGFDLDKKYGALFGSLYDAEADGKDIEYPDPSTALVPHHGKIVRAEHYVVAGGNVHSPPNARRQYDQDNTAPVMSTIEGWRQHGGANGHDIAKPWTSGVLDPYRKDYTDCMGAWLVYWRQNFPGLDNRALDDAGKPMKNWWPFLFY